MGVDAVNARVTEAMQVGRPCPPSSFRAQLWIADVAPLPLGC